MTIRVTHPAVPIEIDVEIDADYREGDEPEVRSLRIAGVELWPLMRDRAEFGAVRAGIADWLADWRADNLDEAMADARAGA